VATQGRAEPLADFVAALRLLRKRAGNPTLRAMARRTQYSESTFCRVQKGKKAPKLEAVLAYVHACIGETELWRVQHGQLLAALREGRAVEFVPWRGFTPDRKEQLDATTVAVEAFLLDRWGVESLAGAMRRMRAQSGLTLTQVAARTALPEIAAKIGGKPLPVSTIGDLCNQGPRRVPSARTLRGFLLAVGAPEAALSQWEETRQILAAGPRSATQESDRASERQLVPGWKQDSWYQPPASKLKFRRVVPHRRLGASLRSLSLEDQSAASRRHLSACRP
jgi:transcriptional regulator with XRE-family HTH domain